MMLRIITGEGKTTPRWSSRLISDLEPEPPGRAGALPLCPHPAQAADEQRVGDQGLGTVDEGVEHLVVAGRRHVERLADRGLLGAGVLPPLALELQDLAVALAQARTRLTVMARLYVRGVHPVSPPTSTLRPARRPRVYARNDKHVIRLRRVAGSD